MFDFDSFVFLNLVGLFRDFGWRLFCLRTIFINLSHEYYFFVLQPNLKLLFENMLLKEFAKDLLNISVEVGVSVVYLLYLIKTFQ